MFEQILRRKFEQPLQPGGLSPIRKGFCGVTALLESGRVPMCEPETVVRLDTPAGLIIA